MIESISCVIPEITIRNDRAVTTSLAVASFFQKLHKDVLRKISTLESSPSFNQRNFTLVEYLDEKKEKRPAYEMTKNGFIFLVMGFTGKKAAAFKEAYIAEFDRMESELIQQKTQPPAAMPIFPVGHEFRYITTVDSRGAVTDIRIAGPDEDIRSYESVLEMAMRAGHVLLPCDEIEKFSLTELVEIANKARRMRDHWNKVCAQL
jgi:Rha family phage regulatory protein